MKYSISASNRYNSNTRHLKFLSTINGNVKSLQEFKNSASNSVSTNMINSDYFIYKSIQSTQTNKLYIA